MITSENNSFEEITSIIGLEADNGWSKGDKIIPPKGNWNGNYYNFSAYIIYSSLDSHEIEDHIDYLLDKFLPYKKQLLNFNSYSNHNYATIKIFMNEIEHIGIFLTKKTLKKINSLGLEIDIDIYK